MPSIDGGDQLSPDYAPWAWIGRENQNFVWQTSQKAEHDGFLYRAGTTNNDAVVCERRPLEDAPSGSLTKRDRVEDVPVALIPQGLFPSLQSMSERIREVRALVDLVDPSKESSDKLENTILSKQE